MTGRADHWAGGDWNAVCFECGRKRKASTLKKNWQGYYVCPEHWEPRQQQDFVRAVPDVITPPWAQPMPEDTFTSVCSIVGREALTGLSIAGCAIAGRWTDIPPSQYPFCTPESNMPRADFGTADCAVVTN